MQDPTRFERIINDSPPPTLSAHLTLHDGVLLDLELGDDNVLVMRAGASLDPAERPTILRLRFSEFQALVEHVVPLFSRRATDLYRPLLDIHALAMARQAYLDGATHDCQEWRHGTPRGEACAVCDTALARRSHD